ncbi:MAG: radical SAM protein [Deltaproteobacteria bacterium]|nr:radical SAM protein [Deltaproteobacteria bacterium]
MGSFTATTRHGREVGGADDARHFEERGWTRVPLLVQWMATARCPLRCPHCLAHEDGPARVELSTAEALDLVDQVVDLGVGEFLITGGEPLVREDLPVVLDRLRGRAASWSLNTAVLPTGEAKRAIERHPPVFAAVSLDGPREVHDAFRGRSGAFDEALASLAFFRSLGVRTAAGTTITRANLPSLEETAAVVARSGASSWGIHLLFPEGRAAKRPDLFPNRRQLARLMRFVARLRPHFPVTFADEFGWCGDWEPLLRDGPLACGAGRLQCVVLPDGEVVPCTTQDRTTSAGNVRQRPLAELWRDGFAELRARRPRGRCGSCGYFPACGGGCWLQRRNDECFRDVWEAPRPLARAAGLAVTLGLVGAAALGDEATGDRDEPATEEAEPDRSGEVAGGLEGAIVAWYGRALPDHGRGLPGEVRAPRVPADPPDDPGWRFFERYRDGELPAGLAERAAAVHEALGTAEHSPALGNLLWRTLVEVVLDGPSAEERSLAERQAVRDVLGELRTAVEAWRREVAERQLDPYLARGRTMLRYRFEMSKALIRPPVWVDLARDTAVERWGRGGPHAEALEGWVDRHPFGEALALTIAAGEDKVWRVEDGACVETEPEWTLGPLDLLFARQGPEAAKVTVGWGEDERREVELPAGMMLTWADVVRLAFEQHGEALAEAGLRPGNPLFLPLARERRAAAWLADFWLF